jgi:hypothetical protein
MNRKQKKMQDLRAAKDKKMKKVAAGLAVVLAVVLAFEVPGMLKGSGGGNSTPPPATTTTTGAPTTGAPTTSAAPTTTPSGTVAAATPVSSTGSTALPNSNLQPKHEKAQLYSFSHFAGKDPFVQQVNPDAGTGGNSSSSTNSGSGSTSAPASSTSAPATAASVKIAGANSGARTLAASGSARISVNGRIQVVRVGASFPSGNPLFRLVGVSNGVARIGIASGSYSSGAQTVSLTSGRTLTLVDTADNVRYSIRLLSIA